MSLSASYHVVEHAVGHADADVATCTENGNSLMFIWWIMHGGRRECGNMNHPDHGRANSFKSLKMARSRRRRMRNTWSLQLRWMQRRSETRTFQFNPGIHAVGSRVGKLKSKNKGFLNH